LSWSIGREIIWEMTLSGFRTYARRFQSAMWLKCNLRPTRRYVMATRYNAIDRQISRPISVARRGVSTWFGREKGTTAESNNSNPKQIMENILWQ
jgi:hypothetical protein